ncbi:MAG: hypothetical protein MZW92_12660 [Comamonadaceae bacterium]|nr:hypothetical protein [Comamonadaceae bacterium]
MSADAELGASRRRSAPSPVGTRAQARSKPSNRATATISATYVPRTAGRSTAIVLSPRSRGDAPMKQRRLLRGGPRTPQAKS